MVATFNNAVLQYTTKDGDVLDAILTKHYRTNGVRVMQTVLEANPGLAEMRSVLPAGVKITLPVIAPNLIVPIVRPWGKLK